MSELHIACAADQRYTGHSAAMLHSALTDAGSPIVAHYLHGPGFPAEDRRLLASMFEHHGQRIEFHEIPDEWVDHLPLQDLFGPVMWYRIFLPELLPAVKRVLYLDVDTIVVDRLDPLWSLDLDGRYLGAVTNIFMPFHRHRPLELGIEAAEYFNSGVLLLNLDLMRREGFTQAVQTLAGAQPERLKWPDQDALNLVVGSRRLALHPRWNCMNSLMARGDLATDVFGAASVTEARDAPAIRHFEGPGANKPWHRRHERAGQRLYRAHRQATPWPDYALEGASRWNLPARLAADVRSKLRT